MKNWTGFACACCVSGLIWTLIPTSVLLFAPVAVFWLIVAGAAGIALGSLIK